MKVHELLMEVVAGDIKPITVTERDGGYVVNTAAKSGPTLDTIFQIWKQFDGKKGITVLTKTGKPADISFMFKNRPNGFVIKSENAGIKDKIEAAVSTAVDKVKKAQKAKDDYKAGAPARKKQQAQWAAERRKEDLSKYDKEFGKGTWNRVTYKQEGGDDGYQYVLRIDGKPKLAGLTKREAEAEKKSAVIAIAKKEKLGKYA